MATEYLDPNGDNGTNEWTPSGCTVHSDCVDDAIREPGTGIDGNSLSTTGSANDEDFDYENPVQRTGNVSAVKIWVYGRCGDSDDNFGIVPSGVSGWSPSEVETGAPGTSNAWVSSEWTGLSIAIAEFDSLVVKHISKATSKGGGSWIIETCYVELTYSDAPTPGTIVWTNGNATGVWSDADNWDLSRKPIDGDDVQFNSSFTDSCTLDENSANLDSFDMQTGYTGTLTLGSYTLQIEYTADGSDFTGTQGTFDAGSGLVKVSRSWDTSSTNFTFTRGTSTIELTGTGNINVRDYTTNGFFNLKTGASGKTTSILTRVGVYGVLTNLTGTLFGTDVTTRIIYLYGTAVNPPLVNTGSLNVQIAYHADGQLIAAGTYGKTLRLGTGAFGGGTFTLDGAIVSSMDFILYCSAGNTSTINTNNYPITVATGYPFNIGMTGNGVVNCGSSTVICGQDVLIGTTDSYLTLGTSVWTISRHWDNASTHASWDEGTSVIKFDGNVAQTIANNGQDFYDIEVSGTGQKNFTESFKSRHFTAKNNVTVKITDVGVTWSTFDSSNITADATYVLTLRSSIDTNQWDMIAGTGNVALRVDVQDSNNTGTDVDATDASNTNSGNNDGWNFGGGIVTLVGSTAGQSGVSGATKLIMEISGSSGGASGASAPLKATREIIGSLGGQSGADGVSKLTMKIVGDSGGVSTMSGAVKVLRELLGSVAGESSLSGIAKVLRELIGSSAGQSSASGTLTISGEILLQGSTAGQSGADAVVKLTMKIVGDADGASGTSSILKLTREIAGTSDAQSAASALVKVIREITGSAVAQSNVSGGVKLTWGLSGSVDAVSSLIGDLTVAVLTIGRTEVEISLTITTGVALDETIGRTVAADRTITRTKAFEVEI